MGKRRILIFALLAVVLVSLLLTACAKKATPDPALAKLDTIIGQNATIIQQEEDQSYWLRKIFELLERALTSIDANVKTITRWSAVSVFELGGLNITQGLLLLVVCIAVIKWIRG